jgi:PKD repeat protein
MTNPGGEGLAFILAADPTLPEGSDGQWLGIVNTSTNEFSQVVAIEFDTRQSYPEDLEDFHVGLDLNRIYSIKQVSLRDYGITLANIPPGNDTWARVEYDGENITVSVNGTGEYMPVIFRRLNLSDHLPEMVYVGFSASQVITSN